MINNMIINEHTSAYDFVHVAVDLPDGDALAIELGGESVVGGGHVLAVTAADKVRIGVETA